MPEQQEQNPAAEPKSKPRVALRVIVGVLLVAGMLGGWAVMGMQKARKQVEAIQAVTAAGGVVYLDYQWKNGQPLANGRPRQAAWLRSLLGPENLDRAVAVDLRSAQHPADLVSWLPLMPHLVDLNARGTPLADVALAKICSLVALTSLDLAGTAVTDDGIRQLRRLTQLTSLTLASTEVTDQSVATLTRLKRLRKLDLSATRLSEDAIERLRKRLPKCQIVHP